MKIYDITQELFSSVVYPGDPVPQWERILHFSEGGVNLSAIHLCAHNGTHMDAPFHFVENGDTVESIPTEVCIGRACVVDSQAVFGEAEAKTWIPAGCQRLLLRGGAPDLAGAEAILAAGVRLLGVEAQSVGDPDVHRCLLSAKMAVLEGIRLDDVMPGEYFLFALPMKLGGLDGAPVRAVLLDGVL